MARADEVGNSVGGTKQAGWIRDEAAAKLYDADAVARQNAGTIQAPVPHSPDVAIRPPSHLQPEASPTEQSGGASSLPAAPKPYVGTDPDANPRFELIADARAGKVALGSQWTFDGDKSTYRVSDDGQHIVSQEPVDVYASYNDAVKSYDDGQMNGVKFMLPDGSVRIVNPGASSPGNIKTGRSVPTDTVSKDDTLNIKGAYVPGRNLTGEPLPESLKPSNPTDAIPESTAAPATKAEFSKTGVKSPQSAADVVQGMKLGGAFDGSDGDPVRQQANMQAIIEAQAETVAKRTGETVPQAIQRMYPAIQNGRVVEAPPVDTNGQHALFQNGSDASPAPTFYSQLQRVVDQKMSPRMNADQLRAMLSKSDSGVKPDEMNWSGMNDYLDANAGKTVNKQDVLDHIAANNVKLNEVVKGGEGTPDWQNKFDNATDALRSATQDLRDTAIHEGVADDRMSASALTTDLQRGDVKPSQLTGDTARHAQTYLDAQKNYDDLQQQQPPASAKTKFQNYVLPDGENYREMLMTLPEKQAASRYVVDQDPKTEIYHVRDTKTGNLEMASARREAGYSTGVEASSHANRLNEQVGSEPTNVYKSQHWDEPNVLAHTRYSDRTDADGNKILHVEEVQSDWHQDGRKNGYQGVHSAEKIAAAKDAEKTARIEAGNAHKAMSDALRRPGNMDMAEVARTKAAYDAAVQKHNEASDALSSIDDINAVPAAPFTKNWHELALRRMLRHAAENGYDKMAWTPGVDQAARYDLSKQIDTLHYQKNDAGNYRIRAYQKNEPVFDKKDIAPNDIEDNVGKEIAQKIVNGEGEHQNGNNSSLFGYKDYHELSGVDLKTGGEGMKGFYDRIVPDYLNKYGKKFGAKVGSVSIQAGGETKALHSIDITPQMRESVMQGQPLFQDAQNPRGSVNLGIGTKDTGALMKFFHGAKLDTAVHETAHIWRRNLAPGDLAYLEQHYGVEGGNWEREHEERFAEDTTNYFKSGKAPTAKLQPIFDQFKDFLTRIYDKLGKSQQAQVSPQVRAVLDRALGSDRELPSLDARDGDGEAAPGVSAKPKANGGAEYAKSVNLDRLGITEDQKQIIRDASHHIGNNADYPGTLNHDLIRRGADALGLTPDTIGGWKNSTLPDEVHGVPVNRAIVLKAVRDQLRQTTERLDLARRENASAESPESRKAVTDAESDFDKVHVVDQKASREFGQSGAVLAMDADPMTEALTKAQEKARTLKETPATKFVTARVRGAKKLVSDGDYAQAKALLNQSSPLSQRAEPDVLHQMGGGKQTDTPEFKRWFGDSKVVDKKGKPQIVYHGTPNVRFDTFNLPKDDLDNGHNSLLYGPGHYFTDNENIAQGYADTNGVKYHIDTSRINDKDLYSSVDSYLNKRKQIESSTRGLAYYKMLNKTLDLLRDNQDLGGIRKYVESGTPSGRAIAKTLGLTVERKDPAGIHQVFLSLKKPFDISSSHSTNDVNHINEIAKKHGFQKTPSAEKNVKGSDYYTQLLSGGIKNGERGIRAANKTDVNKVLEAAGYDGIKHDGGGLWQTHTNHNVYIAFHPEQIKSAIGNRGTFDPADPNILHQMGDNPAQLDAATKLGIYHYENATSPTDYNEWSKKLQADAPSLDAGDLARVRSNTLSEVAAALQPAAARTRAELAFPDELGQRIGKQNATDLINHMEIEHPGVLNKILDGGYKSLTEGEHAAVNDLAHQYTPDKLRGTPVDKEYTDVQQMLAGTKTKVKGAPGSTVESALTQRIGADGLKRIQERAKSEPELASAIDGLRNGSDLADSEKRALQRNIEELRKNRVKGAGSPISRRLTDIAMQSRKGEIGFSDSKAVVHYLLNKELGERDPERLKKALADVSTVKDGDLHNLGNVFNKWVTSSWFTKSGFSAKYGYYLRNSLLSGPHTLLSVGASHALGTGFEEGVINPILAAASRGKYESASLKAALAGAQGAIKALPEAGRILTQGETVHQLRGIQPYNRVSDLHGKTLAREPLTGGAIRTPLRTHSAMFHIFGSGSEAAARQRYARLWAGRYGGDYTKYLDNPTVLAAAHEHARDMVYQSDNAVVHGIQTATREIDKKIGLPLAKTATDAHLTFLSTPLNIAGRGLEYTPVGGAYNTLKHVGNIKARAKLTDDERFLANQKYARQMTRTAVGTALAGGIGAYLTAKGILNPPNTKEHEYGSINFHGKKYGIDRFAPVFTPIEIGGESYLYLRGKDADFIAPFADNPFGNAIQEYQTLQGGTRNSKDTEGAISKVVGAAIATNIPTISSQIASATDPSGMIRVKQGLLSQSMNRVYGLREMLKQGKYAQPSNVKSTGALSLLYPGNVDVQEKTGQSNTPTTKELLSPGYFSAASIVRRAERKNAASN